MFAMHCWTARENIGTSEWQSISREPPAAAAAFRLANVCYFKNSDSGILRIHNSGFPRTLSPVFSVNLVFHQKLISLMCVLIPTDY